MDPQEFTALLQGLLDGIAHGDSNDIEATIDQLSEMFEATETRPIIRSFGEAGLMTRDEGIVIELGYRQSIQITILGVGVFDPPDED